MSIEIYDAAKIVKKDDKYYYFLKYGSKNCSTYGGQMVVDNNFRNHYLRRETRDSHWSIVADGGRREWDDDVIAGTDYNCPTSHVYGRINFGNKKNIALYYVKNKTNYLDYNLLDEEQQANINRIIGYYQKPDNKRWTRDLSDYNLLPEHHRMQKEMKYCDDTYSIQGDGTKKNHLVYKGRIYWDLDNL